VGWIKSKGRIEKDKWMKTFEAKLRKMNEGAKWREGIMEEEWWREQNGGEE
jgi:hypothetical protein